MLHTSQRVALFCATVIFAGLLCCDLDAGGKDKDKDKDKDKKVEKKEDAKDKKDEKKTDAKDKKDEKKEEKKKEEFKPDPAQVELKGHKNWIFAVAFGEDGKTLASASRDRSVKVWDLGTKKDTQSLKGNTDEMKGLVYHQGTVYVTDAKFNKEKKLLEYEIRVWEAKGNKEGKPLKGHSDPIDCLAIDKDGKTLYSGSADQTVKVWDAGSGPEDLPGGKP